MADSSQRDVHLLDPRLSRYEEHAALVLAVEEKYFFKGLWKGIWGYVTNCLPGVQIVGEGRVVAEGVVEEIGTIGGDEHAVIVLARLESGVEGVVGSGRTATGCVCEQEEGGQEKGVYGVYGVYGVAHGKSW